jgi:galactose mutarotase-like enzyme
MNQVKELTLRDDESGAVATVAPERGGIVTGFDIRERRVLFMDRETLRDPAKNVRGGLPVLFPSPGKLDEDAWAYAGRQGSMNQHGFARNMPWQVTELSANAVALRLTGNESTLAQYPWDFTIEHMISVRGWSLRLEQTVLNRSASTLPFGFGFHPYFFVPQAEKGETTIATRATRAFDNVKKQTVAIQGIDLTKDEVDLHLLDHGSSSSELRSPLGGVELKASPEYTHWVVWTLAGRDFVCLEPWTCPGNALNTKEHLMLLEPGQSRSLWLEINVLGGRHGASRFAR